MRIRLFNTFEPVTTIYRDLLAEFAQQGWACEVIVSRVDYRPGRQRLADIPLGKGITISEVGTGRKGRGKLGKLRVSFEYAIGAAARSLFTSGVEVNVFFTQPPMFACWGIGLKLLRRQPYICVLMDIYPDVAEKAGLLKHNSIFARLLRKLSRATWRHASKVVVIGSCMQRYVNATGLEPKRIEKIPNWASEKTLRPISHADNSLRSHLNLSGKFVVLYSGNLGQAHYFDDLLAAARQMAGCKNLCFVFIGSGVRLQQVEAVANRPEINNVLVLPSQPDDVYCLSHNLGDIHFVSLRPEFDGLMVPSKAYSALESVSPSCIREMKIQKSRPWSEERDVVESFASETRKD